MSKTFESSISEQCSLPFAADTQVIALKGYRNYRDLKLKPDNVNRPCWVCDDGYIYLETFQPVSKQASDFLLTMAEPISRPELIHEFQITIFSLYAGLSVGLSVVDLINNLAKFAKNVLPQALINTITRNGEVFGKAKLVLKENRYWIESFDKSELDLLSSNAVIAQARKRRNRTQGVYMNGNIGLRGADALSNNITGGGTIDQSSRRSAVDEMPTDELGDDISGDDQDLSNGTGVLGRSNDIEGDSNTSTNNNIGDYETTEAPVLDANALGFKLTEIGGLDSMKGESTGNKAGGGDEISDADNCRSLRTKDDSGTGGNKRKLCADQTDVNKRINTSGEYQTHYDEGRRENPSSEVKSTSYENLRENTSRLNDKHRSDACSGANNGTNTSTTTTPTHSGSKADKNSDNSKVYSFEIDSKLTENVKRVALEEMHRPLVTEYDFRKDRTSPSLNMTLKSTTSIRYYQERALRKMFSNGRARSGIIVLPCGAGKTLTGITAACTMRKSVIVLTTSAVAVDQWQKQFEDYTSINPAFLKTLTSDSKPDLWDQNEGGVLVSTYTMLAYSGKRSQAAQRVIEQIKSRPWGLLIFDEVQFAPAPAFRKINATVRSHCKLGLTATLVREDDLIKDLQWLIGPKLYEANWLELQERGYLARAQCSEVWCPMSGPFYKEYLRCSHAKQRKLWVCNPNKLMTCEFLLKYHERRGDKVIVFSDNLFALNNAAKALHRPFISGAVSMSERMAIINKFKCDPNFNTLFLSKVGDNAIDIPCANVVIQISFNFASRRQEAQRLGRILRPKPRSGDEFNAFFYSLVSKDTQEMIYADKRQQFIIDQGYSYNVLHMDSLPMEHESLVYAQKPKQVSVLSQVLASDDMVSDFDDNEDNSHDVVSPTNKVKYKDGLAALSGAKPKGGIADMHFMFKNYHTQNRKG